MSHSAGRGQFASVCQSKKPIHANGPRVNKNWAVACVPLSLATSAEGGLQERESCEGRFVARFPPGVAHGPLLTAHTAAIE